MKLVNRPIDVLTLNEADGKIRPYRFRIKSEKDENKVVKVDRVIVTNTIKKNGTHFKNFRCESHCDDKIVIYELMYEYLTCKWVLYKV